MEKTQKEVATLPKEGEELDGNNQDAVVKVVETEAPKPKPEVRPSANPETSGWDELDKNNDEPPVQVVETEAPKAKPEIKPSANPEASGWDALDKNDKEPAVEVVETVEPDPKPEVGPSANSETSGGDALDKNKDEPAVQVVETEAPKPKPKIKPSANPETSNRDVLDKNKAQQSPGTNPVKQTGQTPPSNFLPEIAEMMKKALLIAGRKLEAGEFNDLEILTRQLASYSEDVANTDLQIYAAELANMIEDANTQRRRALLAMRTKIHQLYQFIPK